MLTTVFKERSWLDIDKIRQATCRHKDQSGTVCGTVFSTTARNRKYCDNHISSINKLRKERKAKVATTKRLLVEADDDPMRPAKLLTTAQLMVLELAVRDISYKEVSYMLNISPNTISSRVETIKKKLGVRGLAGMTKYAIKYHLTEPA